MNNVAVLGVLEPQAFNEPALIGIASTSIAFKPPAVLGMLQGDTTAATYEPIKNPSPNRIGWVLADATSAVVARIGMGSKTTGPAISRILLRDGFESRTDIDTPIVPDRISIRATARAIIQGQCEPCLDIMDELRACVASRSRDTAVDIDSWATELFRDTTRFFD